MSSLANAASIQLQVIYALTMRETRTRFGTQRLGYLWAIVEPLMWISTFFVIFYVAKRPIAGGMDLTTFIMTGFGPYLIFMHTTSNCANAVAGNLNLLYYPQVQPMDIIFARTGMEIVTGMMVFAIIMGAHTMVTGGFPVGSYMMTLVGLVMAGLLGMSLGLVFCMIRLIWPTFDRIRSTLMRPMFWISGLFFPANGLPDQLRELLFYNPVMNVVEMTRGGWFASYIDQASLAYVIYWILGLLFVGMTMERAFRSRLHKG